MRTLALALADARRGLRPRRRRALSTGVGIALAAAMLAAAVVISVGLGQGFSRAERAADLPNVIVKFNPQDESAIATRIRALPDVGAFATRFEATDLSVSAHGHSSGSATLEIVGAGRHGYAVVAGHGLPARGDDVLVEKAWADAWGLKPGDTLFVRGLGPQRIAGLAEAPDNVGFPLAPPRFYLARSALVARFGARAVPDRANYAEIWLRNPRYLNEVLVQARATSFGLRDVRFVTRGGIQVLVHQAAGIVIDLLVALSLIALATAGAMLAASARAEVQRRLPEIGVQRAVGASGGYVTLVHTLEAGLVAAPAAAVGVAVGTLVILGPADQLLALLNEPAPGLSLLGPVLLGWVAATLVAVLGAAWPAWRAASRTVVGLLRGGDLAGRTGASSGAGGGAHRLLPTGLGVLGARLVAARRARLATTVITLGLSAGFILLMLSLASELSALQTDPSALGRRYQLAVSLPPRDVAAVRRIPGVAGAAARYRVHSADSFSLGEVIDTIAYPDGEQRRFEDPPLISGHAARGGDEAEIGEGLAQTLGLGPGQTLALQLPDGTELRLRIAGVVSSLDEEGRVAYVPASALLRADPGAPSTLAVRLTPTASTAAVQAALIRLGAAAQSAAGATSKSGPLVAVLRAIVTAVAIVDGLVCLYALIQACALTVQERRRTVAVLRACGAGAGSVRRLLAGAALSMLVPAAVLGVLLERFVLGPVLSNLAANYAYLPLRASVLQIAATVVGLLLAAVLAVLWVSRRVQRESVLSGLAG